MEKKFYTDNFEQFLKESADDFRMYPSRRVWNSLYNNLHPGRKWPSLAVCLLLVSSIIFIGVAHKNEMISPADSFAKKEISPAINKGSKSVIIENAGNSANLAGSDNITVMDLNQHNAIQQNNHPALVNLNIFNNRHANSVSFSHNPTANKYPVALNINSIVSAQKQTAETAMMTSSPQKITEISSGEKVTNEVTSFALSKEKFQSGSLTRLSKSIMEPTLLTGENKKFTALNRISIAPAKQFNDIADKDWMEDYVFYNKSSSKWRARLAYEFYATPSIGFRTLSKQTEYNLSSSSFISGPRTVNTSGDIVNTPALNLETGGSLIYSFTKFMRLKAGLQLNYSNYKIYARELRHPTSTLLLLTDPDPELVSRSTTITNGPGDGAIQKYNSNSYQISLPVGADIKLAGKNNIEWFAGATIQPTFVVGGNGYLLSSDNRNYIYDASVLRKWNVNAGIETFLSYKTKNGIMINAGPQFRYQLFSTYDSRYPFDEKLYNLGVKMGITRNF